jgi:hypothetical protein
MSLLPGFFKDLFGLNFALDWERLLGKRAHAESQRRAVTIRGQWAGNPSLLVTFIDSFNDLLIQRFSRKHSRLKRPFKLAAGRNRKVPDYGNWVRNPALTNLLQVACPILLDCHDLRIKAEIAHATQQKTGQFTRPISYRECQRMLKRLRAAYRELLTTLSKL